MTKYIWKESTFLEVIENSRNHQMFQRLNIPVSYYQYFPSVLPSQFPKIQYPVYQYFNAQFLLCIFLCADFVAREFRTEFCCTGIPYGIYLFKCFFQLENLYVIIFPYGNISLFVLCVLYIHKLVLNLRNFHIKCFGQYGNSVRDSFGIPAYRFVP